MTAARRDDGIVFVARMALAGVAIALGICLFQFAVLGIARPPGIASDTIRLANTAVIMGFFCLAGFSKETGRMRLIYLIGPALALGVVIFTGTRIAMVTYPAVLVVSVLLLAPPRFRLPILGGGVAVLGAVAVGLWLMGNRRFMSIFDAIQTLSSGKDLPDVSIKTRLNLYRAAWTAFQESPLVGHGWSNMMKVTIPLMPDAQRYAQGLPHLHNELLSLAVSAGLVGVACYGVLLITPLVLAIRSIQDSQRTQRIYCMVVLITAYAFMGLTDTMLTFEMHTMLYVVLCAIILRFCRDRDIPQLAG